MPSYEILSAFVVTTAVFAFIPGPAMLYAAARTMAGGKKAGLMAALGIHVGAYAHVITAAAGLSALFHAVPVAYMLVKLAGAIYLIWLGISLFLGRNSDGDRSSVNAPKSARIALMQSISVEILNPKTAIFFMAFLPQFIEPTASLPLWVQFAVLGTIVNIIFTLADVVSVLVAGFIIARVRGSNRVRQALQQAGGAILIALGIRLALQKG